MPCSEFTALKSDPSCAPGGSYRYKIKLRGSGYHLFYKVRDTDVILLVITVGERQRCQRASHPPSTGSTVPWT